MQCNVSQWSKIFRIRLLIKDEFSRKSRIPVILGTFALFQNIVICSSIGPKTGWKKVTHWTGSSYLHVLCSWVWNKSLSPVISITDSIIISYCCMFKEKLCKCNRLVAVFLQDSTSITDLIPISIGFLCNWKKLIHLFLFICINPAQEKGEKAEFRSWWSEEGNLLCC